VEDVLTLEDNRASVGLIDATDTVEDSGLASAVRADEPHDLLRPDIEGNTIEGNDAPEVDGKVSNLKLNSVSADTAPPLLKGNICRPGSIPANESHNRTLARCVQV
jgi:hypothetical protein